MRRQLLSSVVRLMKVIESAALYSVLRFILTQVKAYINTIELNLN